MPLTQAQFIESNLIESLKDYLVTTIITPYNTAVASSSYPAVLNIRLEKPADPQQTPVLPLIVIHVPMDNVSPKPTGIGDGTLWFWETIIISFYPALDTSSTPNAMAAAILRTYAKYALGTTLYIPFKDYTQDPIVQVESMEIMEARLTKITGKIDAIYAYDKYRFDYSITVRYPVLSIFGE